jgi:hypothetical protein
LYREVDAALICSSTIMVLGRQRDNRRRTIIHRLREWRTVSLSLARQRILFRNPSSSFTNNLCFAALQRELQRDELSKQIRRSTMISITRFPFTFGALSDADSLFQFRFKKTDVLRMVNAVGWPNGMTHTTRNRYEVCPLLVTCVILRRATSPGRWRDSEGFLERTSRSLVKYFWKDWSTLWSIEGSL